MSFQTPITIAAAIRNIESGKYLLPAIQREFVWDSKKIEWLFDSIMRDYPISSFLFWRVEGETKGKYKFYGFIKDFRQRYNTHNAEVVTSGQGDFSAILDGQQRLTALFIGLRGSYAYRTPRLHEENSERVYPTRHLFLNIENPLNNEEDGRIYEFKFLTKDDIVSKRNQWFRVSDIFGLSNDFEFNKYLDKNKYKDNEFAYKSLAQLKQAVHSQSTINYFLETEQDIDKSLNIFIRINSGGQPLNFSDLIMSIAVANWKDKDARQEIHGLVDSVRDKGYLISKDFILKTFLYLHSNDIRFVVSNFSKDNAVEFEQKWEKIRDSILAVFDLIKTFGFSDSTLMSKNVLIPIIYYIYHRGICHDFHVRTQHEGDRKAISKWMHIVLLKRLFASSTDSILTQMRKGFTADIASSKIESGIVAFPADKINGQLKREVGITDEFIDDLLQTQMEDPYSFSILAILYQNLDYKNNNFHKDHLHPASSYAVLSEALKARCDWQTYNSIKNLQMLDANENMSKNDKSLEIWVAEETKSLDSQVFLDRHLIPQTDFSINNIEIFFNMRTNVLRVMLMKLLA